MAARIALRTIRLAAERKAAEPRSHRAVQDEQGDARDRNREECSIRDSHRYSRNGGIAPREGKRGGPGYAGNDGDGKQPQSSFKPGVHAALRVAWKRPYTTRSGASGKFYSMNVVSGAPSSATNTAISSAGSVLLALAETRWVAPGGSKNDWPTLKVSTGPPPSCERISPLVT